MSKNLLQDMIKIKIVKNDKIQERVERPESRIFSRSKFSEPESTEEDNSNKGSRYSLWLVALISIVFLFFAISFLFSGVKITINPKVQDLSLDQNFSAIKDSNDSGTLSFDLVAISGEESKIVQVDEEKDLSIKAEGVVVIYNTFSSLPQTLDIDTRLEGSNGKIYKTKEKIKVPGMIGDKPGSIEVGIYASDAGEGYNSAPLDFKIVGFKGSSKYDKFYARSKGEINGGINGKFYQISDTEKVAIVNELENSLREKLLKKITDMIPSGFILFKDAVFLNINNENASFVSQNNQVPVSIKGTLYGFLFNEQKLTKKIIQNNVEDYENADVSLFNVSDLTFSITNKEVISFKDVKNINFNLSGTSKIIWNFDKDLLIADLLGKKKKDFNKILTQYPNVISADFDIDPAWKNSFPDKSKDIEIIVNYPN